MNMLRALRYTAAVAIMAAVGLFFVFSVFPLPSNPDVAPVDSELSAEALQHARELMVVAEPAIDSSKERYRPLPPETGKFRVPESLRPVVDFWKRLYTGLYSFQAVIHDNLDVTRVYGIVDLRNEPGMKRGDYDSTREAALDVLDRYKKNLRYLLTRNYNPDTLSGERKRLHLLIVNNGGKKAFRGSVERMRVQRGLRDVYAQSIARSGRYLEEYRRIFREQGVPEELTLLPHVESSYLFNAHSYAGAVGIWQITRVASARLLKVNTVVDERIDPWRSAEAAARILATNYRSLKSWPLAVTAYNQGLGAMRRAVRQLGTRDIGEVVQRYRGRSFGFVGRNFYCAFVAAVEVVHEHEEYFGRIHFDEPVKLVRHKLTKSAPLNSIAEEFGVDTNTLSDLNPHLRRPAHTSRARIPRGAVINLPADTAIN